MAEGGEGEDEIQFLRTVSNAAAPGALLRRLWKIRVAFVRATLCLCVGLLLSVACHLVACLLHRCYLILSPLITLRFLAVLTGGDSALLFCASLTDSYCLFCSLSQEVDSIRFSVTSKTRKLTYVLKCLTLPSLFNIAYDVTKVSNTSRVF